DGQAPPGGATVTLTSYDTGIVTLPATVTIPAGASSAKVTVTTAPVTVRTPVTLAATYRGTTVPFSLGVLANSSTTTDLSSVSIAPGGGAGPLPAEGTITLTAAAPPAGIVVSLTSSDTTAATVPATVSIPGGGTTASFAIATQKVAVDKSVTVSATYGSTTKTAALMVTAAIQSITTSTTPTLSGNPYLISGNIFVNFPLTINPGVTIKFAPGGGLTAYAPLNAQGT